MRTVLLDTNVLLADPGVVFEFSEDTEIIIPETVLGELDRLKTSRVDPDLRFRGREISRILFELSEQGSLVAGVDVPDSGTLRVVPYDSDKPLPEGFSTRNADDKILAVAYQVCADGCESLTVITNDLNMLLKAQALGLAVERRSGEVEGSWGRRFIIRPFQRYRVPIGILSIALAVFAAIILVSFLGTPGSNQVAGVPTEFREQLGANEQKILDYLVILERDETDLDTRLALANVYYDLRLQSGDIRYSQLAVRHYERYLEVKPDSPDVRADFAASYFYGGQTDRAIQEALRVLEQDPNHLQANFNLGIFYWRGRSDFSAAATQFNKVIELTASGDAQAQAVNVDARAALEQVTKEAEAADQSLPQEGSF